MELTKKEQKLIARKKFRNKCLEIEKNILEHSGSFNGTEESLKTNPIKSTFTDGQYVREIFMPADQLITTKIHKKLHPFFVMSGKLAIISEDGIQEIKAPYHGITKPGTKRIIYTHEDTVFITVHATDKTTVDEVIKDVSTDDFNDPTLIIE